MPVDTTIERQKNRLLEGRILRDRKRIASAKCQKISACSSSSFEKKLCSAVLHLAHCSCGRPCRKKCFANLDPLAILLEYQSRSCLRSRESCCFLPRL